MYQATPKQHNQHNDRDVDMGLGTETYALVTASFVTHFHMITVLKMNDWLIFSARCVHRTNRRSIAIMFVRLSVRPSVCLGRACIVIIRCTLARI